MSADQGILAFLLGFGFVGWVMLVIEFAKWLS